MERPERPRANGCGGAHGALRNGFVRGPPGTQVCAGKGGAGAGGERGGGAPEGTAVWL